MYGNDDTSGSDILSLRITTLLDESLTYEPEESLTPPPANLLVLSNLYSTTRILLYTLRLSELLLLSDQSYMLRHLEYPMHSDI